MSDVQAALLSAIQLSGLQQDAKIVDVDPCYTAVITPTLTAVVPLESKQDLKNALPKMKTCGDLKTFFDTGAQRGIGEFIATTKRFFDRNSDAILRVVPILAVIQEFANSSIISSSSPDKPASTFALSASPSAFIAATLAFFDRQHSLRPKKRR